MIHLAIELATKTFKVLKWILGKTRLYIAAIPISIMFIFFSEWYEANKLLGDCLGIALIIAVGISWIVTLVKKTHIKNKNNKLLIDWAYERYGEPTVYRKRTQV